MDVKKIEVLCQMNFTQNKIITMVKKHAFTLIIGALALTLLFVPEAKAFVQKGLIKTGIFNPSYEKIEADATTASPYSMNLVNAKGESINLQEMEGKVVFINFWATWCPPCIAEMPSIQVLYDKFKDDEEVLILTVEIERKTEKAEAFMQKRNLTLPVYYPNSAIPKELFTGTLPTTVILDKKGNLAHTTLGMADYSKNDIVEFLNELKAY